MISVLLFFHSLMRWLVLISLLYAIYIGYGGWKKGRIFSKWDNAIRHWTATIAHIQLIIGFILYIKNPVTAYFFKNFKDAVQSPEILFFGLLHIVVMLTAIIIITIGSALAKRRITDKEKFKTMMLWFLTALIIILIAVPWPFSPLANRPYIRNF